MKKQPFTSSLLALKEVTTSTQGHLELSGIRLMLGMVWCIDGREDV